MRIFDAAATRSSLTFARLVPALRAMFAAGCVVPPRHVHEVGAAGSGAGFTSLVMPAWQDGRYYGVKVVNIAAANAARGLPGLHASYLLHDATTGVPIALIDGDELTARRTAATSALAASWLARRDATRLLVVGGGRVARLLPDAFRAVRDIEHVEVWARSPSQAEALVAAWRDDGLEAVAVHDLDVAAATADIVSCATLATEPLVHGRCLRDGSHLDLIGGFTPAMREADDDCFTGAAIYVDTDEALTKSGDLLGPMQRSAFVAADVRGNLQALARGEVGGRRNDEERTVFKAVGSGLADLAAAILVVEG